MKNIPYDAVYFNLLKGEQRSEQNLATNPSGFVPSLISNSSSANDGKREVSLTQSLAILEYLEEAYPDRKSLLPPKDDLVGRAHVRELANVIACDVQPTTNLRILRKVASLAPNNPNASGEWAKWLISEGFAAYEKLAGPSAGLFSYGDEITLADVCLVPAIYGALRFGVELEEYPTIKRVFERMEAVDAVQNARWDRQPDCPEELKAADLR